MVSVTFLPSSESVAALTASDSSSILGPPYCGVGAYVH